MPQRRKPTSSREPQPAQRFEIRVRGPLGPTLLEAFPTLTADRQGQDTLLRGVLPDQSALYGVLYQIEALGLHLVEVRTVGAEVRARAKSQGPCEDASPGAPKASLHRHPSLTARSGQRKPQGKETSMSTPTSDQPAASARAVGETPPPDGVPHRWGILFLVLAAQFMVVLDATIVTVALPSIQHGLHFSGQTQLQWVINLYILFFGGFLLLGGRAGDLFGRQRMFIAGVVIFAGASLLNGLSQSPGMLLAGRAVQGFGGALISPAVLSIIIAIFTDTRERTKALGVFAAVSAASSAAGLVLGGVLTQELSWRWIFLVNVPVGVIAALLATRFVPNFRAPGDGRRSLDIAGAVTVTGGLTLLIYGIVNAQKWGWGSGRFLGCAAGAAALLAVFVAAERRSRAPLVRLGIFKIRSLWAANATMFLMVAGMFVVMFFPTLYLQEVRGYSPIKTGLAYLPWPAMMILASSVAQQLLRRFDPRPTLVAGLLLTAGGLFSFHSLPVGGSYASDILPGFLLTAAGAGLAWATLLMLATDGVPAEETGLASGLINSSQQLGSAIGLAVASTVAATYTAHLLHGLHAAATVSQHAAALGAGFHRGFLVAGAVAAAAAVVGAIATPKPRPHPTMPRPSLEAASESAS